MVTRVLTPAQRKQNQIYQTLFGLTDLPKVSFVKINDLDVFEIRHEQIFVPDFKFVWDSVKEQYRVYILLANRETGGEKLDFGYTVCTINGRLAAAEFMTTYGFYHKRRAHNKTC